MTARREERDDVEMVDRDDYTEQVKPSISSDTEESSGQSGQKNADGGLMRNNNKRKKWERQSKHCT